MTKVLIIDDHAMVRRGIQYILDMEDDIKVTGELDSGKDAGAFVAQGNPDVVLLDIRMPVVDGLTALKDILSARPEQRIIMLTNDIYEAIRLGAKGYLMKDRNSEDLVDAVRKVASGGTFFPEAVQRLYSERVHTKDLSERELTALDYMAKGCTNKEIADALDVSTETVKSYLKGLYQKLEVEDRVSAVLEGYRRGFLHSEK